MGKKILILNGSPRANGNTVALIDEFTKGAEEAGHQVTRFDLQKMNILGCIGCLAGGKNPDSPCTQKDDMDKIYPVYKEADIVVLASPLYYWTISGQLKVAIDRLFAVSEISPNWETPKKECMLIVAAGTDDSSEFTPLADHYRHMTKYLDWKDRGQLLVTGVLNIGDIKDNPALEKARKLGSSIA